MEKSEWEKVGVPVVERAKGEIMADVWAGRVPSSVGSFAELHDHVDANGYGGAFEGEWDGSDETVAFWNHVQSDVDAWIKAGGIADEIAADEADDTWADIGSDS